MSSWWSFLMVAIHESVQTSFNCITTRLFFYSWRPSAEQHGEMPLCCMTFHGYFPSNKSVEEIFIQWNCCWPFSALLPWWTVKSAESWRWLAAQGLTFTFMAYEKNHAGNRLYFPGWTLQRLRVCRRNSTLSARACNNMCKWCGKIFVKLMIQCVQTMTQG